MVDYQDRQVGKGTLWIKLKISENDVLEDHKKQVLEDHKDDVVENEDKDEVKIPKDNDDNNNTKRICHVCNKGFSSGKALRGHMRIHVQATKKQLKGKKLKPLVARYYKKRILQQHDEQELDFENYNNDQLLPTCSICGKNFPSMKSLFGHMRCHPERAWRGIHPPHLKKSCDEIDKKTASAITTANVVPGWSVTAKRGRKPIADEEDTNSGPKKDEEQLHYAVHHLMLLANGDSVLESGLTGGDYNKHRVREELETTNSNSLTSKVDNDEIAYHVSEWMIIDNKKRSKKMKFLDSVQDNVASPVATPEKYKCNTCKKSFVTHHALGGHMSSHNKLRMVIQNSDVTNVVAISAEAAASNSKLLADSKLVCYSNKNFTTNRCQLDSPIDHQAAGASSNQLTSRRILDFDLNEVPPDHEDEVAVGLWRKREDSVGLLRGLRPWKVGADKSADAIVDSVNCEGEKGD
ncbi:hypothetical protein K7X08_005307 [Anisodus acutangulus]|uniref:C2H2-type domain-containing protein n=1 Tax=Anisodus acutangulus TaxID=402998 RepID=A0A9Q1LT66_9SOLA|nr:hypothetical protein K7X08_005307 [Anisodus acutangulus]